MFSSYLEPLATTTEDKIDYIYREMRRTETDRRASLVWKWFWRIVLLLLTVVPTLWLMVHPESLFDGLKGISGMPGGGLQGLPTDLK